MKAFPREAAYSYAILLVILFAIAAIAVWQTLSYFGSSMAGAEYHVAAGLLCLIFLGLMLIAGAFGLWAIQFSARREGRRRVSLLVDNMDYLQDGILAVDPKGRVTGANPAARTLQAEATDSEALTALFPCLTAADLSLLLASTEPDEIERRQEIDSGYRTLRFRSQPTEGMTLMLVSDVTTADAKRVHNRHTARLQLIGQIARGLSHDLNNLLCSISGHVSLLTRLPPNSEGWENSIRAVTRSVERGSAMAGHLLELSRPDMAPQFTYMSLEYMESAVERLRGSLSEQWHFDTDIHEFPPVPLTGIQIEQAVINLGLLVADAHTEPGGIRIIAAPPEKHPMLNTDKRFGAVIVIASSVGESELQVTESPSLRIPADSGVIVSVIRSMIEEAGGRLDTLSAADGSPVYRISLPRGRGISPQDTMEPFPGDLGPYIASWCVLLARPRPTLATHDPLVDTLKAMKVNTRSADDIVSVLAHMESSDHPCDAIVIDEHLLRQESVGILRAVMKLSPGTGIVVVSDRPQQHDTSLTQDVVFVKRGSPSGKVILSMIEAKSLAIHRKKE